MNDNGYQEYTGDRHTLPRANPVAIPLGSTRVVSYIDLYMDDIINNISIGNRDDDCYDWHANHYKLCYNHHSDLKCHFETACVYRAKMKKTNEARCYSMMQ